MWFFLLDKQMKSIKVKTKRIIEQIRQGNSTIFPSVCSMPNEDHHQPHVFKNVMCELTCAFTRSTVAIKKTCMNDEVRFSLLSNVETIN